MTKNYYRSEYSGKQWKALIDKATELGCQITYSKYGNIVTIDSTDRESRIIATTGRDGQDRAVWAERIHGMIQESMNTLGFTKLQQYIDYLDGCYSHVTNRSSRECMTLAAADRNGLGATPTAALSLILAFAILLRSN